MHFEHEEMHNLEEQVSKQNDRTKASKFVINEISSSH